MYAREKLPDQDLPAVELEPWRKALMDAAGYIRVHGHCNTGMYGRDRSVCVAVALSQVGTPCHVFIEAIQHFSSHLGIANGLGDGVVNWNDQPERTAAEVVAALEAAARS